jgi:hypothetical protein
MVRFPFSILDGFSAVNTEFCDGREFLTAVLTMSLGILVHLGRGSAAETEFTARHQLGTAVLTMTFRMLANHRRSGGIATTPAILTIHRNLRITLRAIPAGIDIRRFSAHIAAVATEFAVLRDRTSALSTKHLFLSLLLVFRGNIRSPPLQHRYQVVNR